MPGEAVIASSNWLDGAVPGNSTKSKLENDSDEAHQRQV
jgi:hypothetical protein